MPAKNRAWVSLPDEGEIWWSQGCLTVFRADSEHTGGAFALIEETGPQSDGIPLHRHPADDESFYILEGVLTFHLGEAGPITAPAGTFVYIPKGESHSFRVESETARYLLLTTPHHAQFYRAIAEPAESRTLPDEVIWDMPKIEAACAQFGVEIMGPSPGRPEAS